MPRTVDEIEKAKLRKTLNTARVDDQAILSRRMKEAYNEDVMIRTNARNTADQYLNTKRSNNTINILLLLLLGMIAGSLLTASGILIFM